MMVYLTCDGYTVVAEGRYDDDAPATCARLERERSDGWCVVASLDGKLVADAEGWLAPERPDEFDLACERRFD